MARDVRYPEVIAVRLSVEGKTKLAQLAVLMDKPEAEVMRLLVKWAKFRDVAPVQFLSEGVAEGEICQV